MAMDIAQVFCEMIEKEIPEKHHFKLIAVFLYRITRNWVLRNFDFRHFFCHIAAKKWLVNGTGGGNLSTRRKTNARL